MFHQQNFFFLQKSYMILLLNKINVLLNHSFVLFFELVTLNEILIDIYCNVSRIILIIFLYYDRRWHTVSVNYIRLIVLVILTGNRTNHYVMNTLRNNGVETGRYLKNGTRIVPFEVYLDEGIRCWKNGTSVWILTPSQ